MVTRPFWIVPNAIELNWLFGSLLDGSASMVAWSRPATMVVVVRTVLRGRQLGGTTVSETVSTAEVALPSDARELLNL